MHLLRYIILLVTLTSHILAAEKPMTLGDLGISEPAGANVALQHELEKRSLMLQWHQWLGIAAIVPMVGTYVLGTQARNNADTRDLHMLETVKGALHPVLSVRSRFAPRLGTNGELNVDLEIELAGRKSTVRGVIVRTELLTNKSLKVVGNFIIQLSDFGIERPSLLGMAVKDSVPIEFISTWEK